MNKVIWYLTEASRTKNISTFNDSDKPWTFRPRIYPPFYTTYLGSKQVPNRMIGSLLIGMKWCCIELQSLQLSYRQRGENVGLDALTGQRCLVPCRLSPSHRQLATDTLVKASMLAHRPCRYRTRIARRPARLPSTSLTALIVRPDDTIALSSLSRRTSTIRGPALARA